jgi:protein TonB
MKIIVTPMLLLCFYSVPAQTDTAKIIQSDSVIYYNPEIQAVYPGGIAAWYRYLQKNLTYPANAADYNVQGQVVTQFIVDSNGTAHDFTIVSGPEQLRAESIRVLKKVKLWYPAIHHGKKVNSWKTQPLNFRLESR